jgi:hypothetical protein
MEEGMKIEIDAPKYTKSKDKQIYTRLLKHMGYSDKEISMLIPCMSQSKPILKSPYHP